MKALVTYASAHGSTAEVARFIGRVFDVYDVDVTVAHADTITDVGVYDLVVMGSAVHSSMWLPSLSQFMFRFEDELANKQSYLWLSCIIVVEPDGYNKALENYIWNEALDRLKLPRERVQIFAGKMDWDGIEGNEKWILSSHYEGKELPGRVRGDYRDWQVIANWAHAVAEAQQFPLDFSAMQGVSNTTKDETITEEEVENLAWPDNPGESAPV